MRNLFLAFCIILSGSVSAYTLKLNGASWIGYTYSCYGTNVNLTVSFSDSIPPDSCVWYDMEYNVLSTTFSYSAAPGEYYVTIIDNGFEYDNHLDVYEEDPLSIYTIHGNISTYGGNDGYVNLTAVEGGRTPYSYLWSDSATTRNDSFLVAGIYSVIVTDISGCTATRTDTLTQPAQHLTITSITPQTFSNGYNISKNGATDGKMKVNISGGAPPYRLNVNGLTLSNDTVRWLAAREYIVVAKDVNNCVDSATITLTEPPGKNDWGIIGNSNTDSTTQFLGTTDAKPIIIKTNNIERIHIEKGGKIIFKSPIEADEITLKKPLKIDTLKINRIMPQDGDTMVRIGAGSIFVTNNNGIIGHNTGNTTPIPYDGIGIGHGAYSQSYNGFACGIARIDTNSDYSSAIGNLVKIGPNATNAMVIGSGFGNNFLTNSTTNSILIGANSPIPSIAITPGNNTTSGNVGIGTKTPLTKLHILVDATDTVGGFFLDRNSSSTPHSEIQFRQQGAEKWAIGTDIGKTGMNDDFFIWSNNRSKVAMTISNALCTAGTDVAVGIDFNRASIGSLRNPNYKLYVNGSIACKELKVTATENSFPDYVFNHEYKLIPITDLKSYIDSTCHLPGIPSANEVMANDGYEIGKLQLKLLEKIEEQTLYIINLESRLVELEKKISTSNDKLK